MPAINAASSLIRYLIKYSWYNINRSGWVCKKIFTTLTDIWDEMLGEK